MRQKQWPGVMEQGGRFHFSCLAEGGSHSLTEQMRWATRPYCLLASPPYTGSFRGTAKELFSLKNSKSPGWSISDTTFTHLDISATPRCDRVLLHCITQFPCNFLYVNIG